MWYVRSRGKVSGPFPESRIRVMRSGGEIQTYDEVSLDRVRWEAVDFSSIFAPPLPPPPSPVIAKAIPIASNRDTPVVTKPHASSKSHTDVDKSVDWVDDPYEVRRPSRTNRNLLGWLVLIGLIVILQVIIILALVFRKSFI